MTQLDTEALNRLGKIKDTLSKEVIGQNALVLTQPGVTKLFDDIFLAIQGPQPATDGGSISHAQGELRAQVIAKPVDKFSYGAKSQREMVGVKPELIAVASHALAMSTDQDWTFYDGVRTHDEQIAHIKAGVSSTLNSLHLVQSDGLSHAMDLVPIIDGLPKWDWNGCFRVASWVTRAALNLGLADQLVWGGCWYLSLKEIATKFGVSADAMAEANAFYSKTHPGKDFVDGPHFQWGGKMSQPK